MTRSGEIVWDYVFPYIGAAPLMPLLLHGEAKSNWVYRCPAQHTEAPAHAPEPSRFHVPG